LDHRQQVESLPQTAKRTSTQTRRGTIARVAADPPTTNISATREAAPRSDRIDREHAQPLNVEALARDANCRRAISAASSKPPTAIPITPT